MNLFGGNFTNIHGLSNVTVTQAADGSTHVIHHGTKTTPSKQNNDTNNKNVNISGIEIFKNTGYNCNINASGASKLTNEGLSCKIHLSGAVSCTNSGYECTITMSGAAKCTNTADNCTFVLSGNSKLYNSGNKCNITYDSTANVNNTGIGCKLHKKEIKMQSQILYHNNGAIHSVISTGGAVTVGYNLNVDHSTLAKKKLKRKNKKTKKEKIIYTQFECPICTDTVDKGISGKCGHVLCIECYNKLLKNTRVLATCPLCRKKL